MPLLPTDSYYDKNYRQGAALLRARQPYLVKNIVVGLGLFSVVVGIYSLTFKLIGQDDFSDVKVPDAPKQTVAASDSKILQQVSGKKP